MDVNTQNLVERFAGRGAATEVETPPAAAGVPGPAGQVGGSEPAAAMAPAGRFLAHVDESSF